jgi:hypothetical protein
MDSLQPMAAEGAAVRPSDADRITAIEERLAAGDRRFQELADSTAEIKRTTNSIHELMEGVRSGFKVLGHLGTVAAWIAKVAGAIAAVWGLIYAFKHGGRPPAPGE